VQVRGEKDLLVSRFADGHVDRASGADGFPSGVQEGVGEREGSLPDPPDFDLYLKDIPDKKRRFVVGFRVDDGEEEILAADKFREPEPHCLQQRFIGVVDHLELVGEEDHPRGVGVMKFYFGLVGKHGIYYSINAFSPILFVDKQNNWGIMGIASLAKSLNPPKFRERA